MKIFIYPNNENSIILLRKNCNIIELPQPLWWDFKNLRSPIHALIMQEENSSPFNPICPKRDTSIIAKFSKAAPMIFFYGVPIPKMKQLINQYRKDGFWLIFAIITKSSMKMTLSCLLRHLIEDRRKEQVYKKLVSRSSMT